MKAGASLGRHLSGALGMTLIVAYPILVYGLLRRGMASGALSVAGLSIVVGVLRFVQHDESGPLENAPSSEVGGVFQRRFGGNLSGALGPLALAAFAFGAWLTREDVLLLAAPVAINLGLLFVFSTSLLGTPIVERFARLHDPQLSGEKIAYCRAVTIVWCCFFALNAALTALLALFGSLEAWTLHTGLLSYVAIGLLFAGEWLVRRRRFGSARKRGAS